MAGRPSSPSPPGALTSTRWRAHLNARGGPDPAPTGKGKATDKSWEPALPPQARPRWWPLRTEGQTEDQTRSPRRWCTGARWEPQRTPPRAGRRGVLRAGLSRSGLALGPSGEALAGAVLSVSGEAGAARPAPSVLCSPRPEDLGDAPHPLGTKEGDGVGER